MKEKMQTLIGLIIVVALVGGAGWSFYNRSIADPKLQVTTSHPVSGPISGALFWHETDLEKTAFAVAATLTGESTQFTTELHDMLASKGVVSSERRIFSKSQ